MWLLLGQKTSSDTNTTKTSRPHFLLLCRDVDASNLEALLWTATRLGIERLVAGLASYLTSSDVIACAPCQVGPLLTANTSEHPKNHLCIRQ